VRQCPQCGAEVGENSRFCAACGAAQTEQSLTSTIPVVVSTTDAPARQAQALADLPRGVTALVVERGPDAGTRFILTSPEGAPVSIGRDAESDIFLDDVTVSRRHASASFDGVVWHLQDAGSLNGTYVNGTRCAQQSLQSGDVVNIGKFRFIVMTGESA